MLGNDASSAGVAHGGLFSTAEIKILICYILSALDEPVPSNMLINILHYEGIANGFEVSDAIVSLSKSGQIEQATVKDDTYRITQSGRDVAATLNTSLTMTVKERAYLATLKMLARFKNSKDNKIEVTRENGKSYITCTGIDGDTPFISVKMLIADDSQGYYIKEKFLENPSEIYTTIIELLTK